MKEIIAGYTVENTGASCAVVRWGSVDGSETMVKLRIVRCFNTSAGALEFIKGLLQ